VANKYIMRFAINVLLSMSFSCLVFGQTGFVASKTILYKIAPGTKSIMQVARDVYGDERIWKDIVLWNKINPPYSIKAGQILSLNRIDVKYKVSEKAPLLSMIALENYGNVKMAPIIARWNGLSPQAQLKVGQILTLKLPPSLFLNDRRAMLVKIWKKFKRDDMVARIESEAVPLKTVAVKALVQSISTKALEESVKVKIPQESMIANPPEESVTVKAPVGSVTVKPPIESVTVKAPVESVTVKAPVESVTVKAPVESVTVKAPVESVTVKAPVESVTVKAPEESVTVKAPEESVTVKAPEESVTVKAPEESVTVKAPEESVTVKAPEESVTVKAPEESVTVKAPEESVAPKAPQEFVTMPAPGADRMPAAFDESSSESYWLGDDASRIFKILSPEKKTSQ
jgi:hypothetical protein